MTITFTMEQEVFAERSGGDAGAAPDALVPLLAGARARGMCDAFDLLGLGVVLIDEAGMVLHANGEARRLTGAHLGFAGGHLVAAGQDGTRAIQALIAAALEGGTPAPLPLGPLALRALPVPGDSCQLLKVLVVLEHGPATKI